MYCIFIRNIKNDNCAHVLVITINQCKRCWKNSLSNYRSVFLFFQNIVIMNDAFEQGNSVFLMYKLTCILKVFNFTNFSEMIINTNASVWPKSLSSRFSPKMPLYFLFKIYKTNGNITLQLVRSNFILIFFIKAAYFKSTDSFVSCFVNYIF